MDISGPTRDVILIIEYKMLTCISLTVNSRLYMAVGKDVDIVLGIWLFQFRVMGTRCELSFTGGVVCTP